MTGRRLLCLGSLLALAAGCGRDRAASGEAGRDSTASSRPLVLLLDVPAAVRAGEEVPVAVTIVNRGAASVGVGGLHPDVVVAREDGTEVWRRSRHEAAAPVTRPAATLRTGEMRGSGSSWNQRDHGGRAVPPGTYRIRAEVPAMQLRSEPRTVIIQP